MDEPERLRRRRADSDDQRRGRGPHPSSLRRNASPPAGARRARRGATPATAHALDRRGRGRRSTPARSCRTRRAWRCCALASTEYGYDIDPGEVASIWRAGCIIRAALLDDIRARVPARSEPRQPAARRGVPRRRGGSASRRWRVVVADRDRARHSGAGHERLARLLRLPTAARGCPPTSRRPSATSSAPTRIAASIARASSTRSGRPKTEHSERWRPV